MGAHYSCSSELFGFDLNRQSCIDAIRQLDSRDDKQKIWQQRGPFGGYDIGLPRALLSCKPVDSRCRQRNF